MKKTAKKAADPFEAQLDALCAALRAGDDIRAAIKKSGAPWETFHERATADIAVAGRIEAARAARESYRLLVRLDEMHRRAVDGFTDPIVSAGKLVTDHQVYSDMLLLNLVKADNPDKFADRSKSDVTVTGNPWADIVQHIEGGPAPAKPE